MLNTNGDTGAALDALQRAGIATTIIDDMARLERPPADASTWVLCHWERLVDALRVPQATEHDRRLHGLADNLSDLLTIILGYADIALDTITEDDPAHAAIVEIRSAATRAAGLTPHLSLLMRPKALPPDGETATAPEF